MALYHFSLSHISRSRGSKVVASAAYRAGQLLHDRYYDEVHDYTKKHGVLYSEILLPENAPKSFLDRETLWNEVEKIEKHKKAQLAYSFDVALQNELSFEENKELALRFVKENFVSKGMIADIAIHDPDKHGGIPNPHFHVICPMRPLNSDGTFGSKQRRVYRLDDQGNRIKGKNGKDLFDAVPTTDWNNPETLNQWRENWAKLVNQTFNEKGINASIDNRSNEARGIMEIPQIHEGPNVRAMEAKGIRTEIGDWNRMVKDTNKIINKLYKQIMELVAWIKELKLTIANAQADKKELNTFADAINSYYEKRNAGAYSNRAKLNNIKEQAEVIAFISDNNIHNLNDLAAVVDSMYSKFEDVKDKLIATEKNISMKKNQLSLLEERKATLPIYQEYLKIKSNRKKQAFYEDNRADIVRYHMTTRQLKEIYGGKLPTANQIKENLPELLKRHDELSKEYSALKSKTKQTYKLKRAIEDDYKKAIGFDIPKKDKREVSL